MLMYGQDCGYAAWREIHLGFGKDERLFLQQQYKDDAGYSETSSGSSTVSDSQERQFWIPSYNEVMF